jgi:hypothetical protein
MNHGEHRRVGADAEREGQDGDYGEAGSFGEQTKCVANVGDESIHGLTPGLYAGIDVERGGAFPVVLMVRDERGWRVLKAGIHTREDSVAWPENPLRKFTDVICSIDGYSLIE